MHLWQQEPRTNLAYIFVKNVELKDHKMKENKNEQDYFERQTN